MELIRDMTELRLRVVFPSGMHVPMCSSTCLTAYLVATSVVDKGLARVDGSPVTPTASCAHCGWCGRQVLEVGECRLHGGDCRAFDWSVTVAGQRAVRWLLDSAPAQRRVISDQGWAKLTAAAERMHRRGIFPSARLLFDLVKVQVWWVEA